VEVYAGELVVGVDDHVPLRFLHLHTDVVVCDPNPDVSVEVC
jgi:hypothetical protein